MPAIIVNRPVPMLKVDIIIPKWYVEKATNLLHKAGVVHVTKQGKGIRDYLSQYNRAKRILTIINTIFEKAKGRILRVSVTRLELEEITLDKIEDEINKLKIELDGLEDKIKSLEEDRKLITDTISILSYLPHNVYVQNLEYSGKYLFGLTVYGKRESILKFLKELNLTPYYLGYIGDRGIAILITHIDRKKEVLEAISTFSLKILKISNILDKYEIETEKVGELLNYLKVRLKEINEDINDTRKKFSKKLEESIEYLGKYMVILENIVSRLETILKSYPSKYMVVLSGWVPKRKVTAVERILRENNIPFYLEVREPIKGEDEPPTLLENPPIIRWYEPIVKFLGIPRYWEWDPTPIIAYSFTLFFGMMLGDMGYAIAIILATLFILDKFVADKENRDYVYFKRLLIVSSIVGFIIGALSGSFLGDTLAITGVKYSITNVFSNPVKFLVLAIIIGLVHVNISHILTLIRAIKEKETGTVLEETGLFIAQIFGIPYVLYTMLNTPVPGIPEDMYTYLLYGALAGVLIIIVGAVKNLGFLGGLMWLFSLTGLLGDVLSYSRLAGVGMATMYLAASFNKMALMAYDGLTEMLSPTLGMIVGAVVALMIAFLGHILNTALSALGGFVHSLRLCFVEFLSKFYEGTGYPFEPLRVIIKKNIVIE